MTCRVLCWTQTAAWIARRRRARSPRTCQWAARSGTGRLARPPRQRDRDPGHPPRRIELTPLDGPGRRSVFDTGPERLAIVADDGTVIGKRDDPRASFAGFDRTTPWDLVQTTYFISYAMWNYLTSPFLLTYPGVQTKEIEPWQENGQTWRALAITFPDAIATHSTAQIFY